MRIVSAFRQAPERALETLRRFPIVLLAGAFLAWVIIAQAESSVDEQLLMTALLAIILAFDLTLLKERLGIAELPGQAAVLVGTGAALAAIYVSIDLIARETFGTAGVPGIATIVAVDEPIRIAAIGLALHALAAAIPFLGRRSLTGFWDYNRTLFLRVLSSGLFSGVLYAGLAGALLAIDELLGIEVTSDTYADLFAVMAGVVTTWFFLAGVPEARQPRESEAEAKAEAVYPRGLKVFVQFVLLPLTAVYLVILYAYTARIAIEWSLPEGQVSWLIFSYAVMGILSYLLIYPLRDDEENRWIRTFARGFFIALAPLLVVLVVALSRRIGDYGLTEPRYYGFALAAWLAVMVAYFLTRREDIRIIPITLAVASLVTTFGPWGATSVAVRSQVGQLEEIIERPKPWSEEKMTSVRSIAQFLAERGRLADAAPLVTQKPDTIVTAAMLVAATGIDPAWLGNENQNLHYSFNSLAVTDLRGYSDLIDITGSFDSMAISSAELGPVRLGWRQPGVLSVSARGETIDIRLDSIAESLAAAAAIADTAAGAREAAQGDIDGRKLGTDSEGKQRELVPDPEGKRRDGRDGDPPTIERAGRTLRARLILRWLAGSRPFKLDASANDLSGLLLIGPVAGGDSARR